MLKTTLTRLYLCIPRSARVRHTYCACSPDTRDASPAANSNSRNDMSKRNKAQMKRKTRGESYLERNNHVNQTKRGKAKRQERDYTNATFKEILTRCTEQSERIRQTQASKDPSYRRSSLQQTPRWKRTNLVVVKHANCAFNVLQLNRACEQQTTRAVRKTASTRMRTRIDNASSFAPSG